MMSKSLRSWATKLARTTAEYTKRAGHWWLREFLNLVPERTAKWLIGPGRATLVLVNEGESRVLELLDGSRRLLASERVIDSEYSAASIEQFFQAHGVQRSEADIGIRLPPEKVFRRKLILPAQAAGSISEIIATDLARKTPFRLQDIYHGHRVTTPDDTAKIVVWQWLVRRVFIEDAATQFDLGINDVAFVATSGSDNADAPVAFIALRPDAKTPHSWIKTSLLALSGSAVALGLAAGALKYERQQAMIDSNDSRIAAVRVRAQKVRSEFDKVQEKQNVLLRLRMQKRDLPGLLDLWEEVTRVLPAHSWLTELRLTEIPEKNDRSIAMTGFSAGANDLVKLVDQSSLLADASLTAPVALDPVEGRERFVLQAKIKRAGSFREAAR